MLKRALFLVCLSLGVLSNTVMALGIFPVHVYFEPNDKMESVTLNNTSNQPINLQVRAYQWTQKNGQDVDTPTQDLIVSPAMLKVPANSKQLVRIALRNPAMTSPTQQKTYRILITQIMPKTVQSPEVLPVNGVEEEVFFKVQMSVPIFVEPKIEKAQLTVNATGQNVNLVNTGNVTQLISQITWMKGQPLATVGVPASEFIYLLPGSHHNLTTAPGATALKVITNQTAEVFELN